MVIMSHILCLFILVFAFSLSLIFCSSHRRGSTSRKALSAVGVPITSNGHGGGQSDNESEASGVSWSSGLHQRKRNESGSESESRSSRRIHRSRRKR